MHLCILSLCLCSMKKTSLLSLCAVLLLAGCSQPTTPVVVDDTLDIDEVIDVVDAEDGEDMEDVVAVDAEDAEKTVFVMDTDSSEISWKADRVLSAGHYGTIALKSGTAVYVNSRLTSAEAVIDMTTIASEAGEKLDTHLSNEDFFDVENHPEASIVITSTEVTEGVDGEVVTATADLTIKGITQEITFPLTEDTNGTTALITIDRTLWDIKYGSEKFFDDLADKAIKDTIEFEVKIVYK